MALGQYIQGCIVTHCHLRFIFLMYVLPLLFFSSTVFLTFVCHGLKPTNGPPNELFSTLCNWPPDNCPDFGGKKVYTKGLFQLWKLKCLNRQKRGLLYTKKLVFKGKNKENTFLHQRAFKVFLGDPFAQYWCIDFGLPKIDFEQSSLVICFWPLLSAFEKDRNEIKSPRQSTNAPSGRA